METLKTEALGLANGDHELIIQSLMVIDELAKVQHDAMLKSELKSLLRFVFTNQLTDEDVRTTISIINTKNRRDISRKFSLLFHKGEVIPSK
jgi:hypothetical protein